MSGSSLPPVVIGQRVNRTLQSLLDLDSFLLVEDAHERTVAHKLALYLGHEFPRHDVDLEYNREGIEQTVKRLEIETDEKDVFPDVIIHERCNQSRNCLVIELKLDSSARPRSKDVRKLRAFTGDSDGYQYDFGLFVEFSTGSEIRLSDTKWFRAGSPIGPLLEGYPKNGLDER